jgi:hypothetical protein
LRMGKERQIRRERERWRGGLKKRDREKVREKIEDGGRNTDQERERERWRGGLKERDSERVGESREGKGMKTFP